MKVKGIIFDLDGTLLDSMSVWDDIGGKYLKSQGRTPDPELREKLRPLSLAQSAQLLQEQYQLPYTEKEIMAQINSLIEKQYLYSVSLKPKTAEFLEKLAHKGIKMAIATATDRYLVEAALERLNIAGYFSFIITCGEIGCGKDQPAIYTKALEQLETGLEETVIFEDALHAVQTAKAAGYTVIGVHDPSAAKDEQALRAVADDYIYSFEEWEV